MREKTLPNGNVPKPHISIASIRHKESNCGSILIACLIVLATLTIYGTVLVSLVYERSLLVSLENDRLQALYLAEAALAKSLQEVKSLRDVNSDGLGTIPRTPLGRGVYYSIHDPGTLTITGIGEVKQIQRRVRIYYEGI